MKSAIIILFSLATLTFAHQCQHGHVEEPLRYLESTGVRTTSLFAKSERFKNLQSTYQSIRIYADYSNLGMANSTQKDYIMNQLMPNTISYFQNTLKVVRLTTNVKAEFVCFNLAPPADLVSTGVAADIIILVGANKTGVDGARAVSGACGLSQINNRPSFGSIIFNLDLIDLNSAPLQEQYLVTTIHETVHILGFSKPLYAFYIDPVTGQKLTNHVRTKIVNYQNVTLIDLPPLTSKLREFFNCSTIEGAYLEGEGGTGNAGTHFERRVFQNELMVGQSRVDQVISQFTLALLEGTGWYQPDYNMTEDVTWGFGDGCGFYDGPCVAKGGVPLYDEYCAPLTRKGCSFNYRGKAFCGAFPGYIMTDPNLPAIWDYWGNKTVVGYKFNDNCPVYNYYANSDCEDPLSKPYGISGEVFGHSSRCFVGTLTKSSTVPPQTGYCFSVKCVLNPSGFSLTLNLSSGATVACLQKGPVKIAGYNGTLTCPDPNEFCGYNDPNYCERGCLGKGSCVLGQCSCIEGWTGSDCGSRVYVNGCSRCASNPTNKTCYGDLCLNSTLVV